MIVKIPEKRKDGKSSFRQLIDYVLSGKNKEIIEYVGSQNIMDIETAALEMEILSTENKRCKDPVFHLILSFRELEIPTLEQVNEAVQIVLEEHNLKDCQAIWSLHHNTENRHIHIVVNRIDPETARAIQPAENWTKKANERAARRIEVTQGWEILQTGHHYTVDSEGEIISKGKENNPPPTLSAKAKDIEAHTAEKSAESIGQEVAAPIIRAALTWEELHEKLAAQGISFERKGSGAVLKVGEVFIKASVAGRDISLSKLEARLGKYEARDHNIFIASRQSLPVEKISPQIARTWEEYKELRTEYYSTKNKGFAELMKYLKGEAEALAIKQKEERNNIFSDINWKGRGKELNQLRSVLAAQQKVEKLNFRDRRNDELKKFKGSFPKIFPSFKVWLQEKDDPLYISFRYQHQSVMQTGTEDENKRTIYPDLRSFTAIAASKGGVAYVRENNITADFLDYGNKIVISEKYDSTSILAALQLASQKWGSVNLSGTEEYKILCADIAAKHNIKITNPELQITRKTENEMIKEVATEEKAIKQFNQYADAVDADNYRITVTEFKPDVGVQAFVLDKSNNGKNKYKILNDISKLREYEKDNKNINVTPISADKHHILIDDVSVENLDKLRADGYIPACVVESSPSNYQVILNVYKIDDDRESANKITKELNKRYGDPKLSGATHAHRLPPFANFKPKHQREDGTFPETKLIEAFGGMCEKAFNELKAIDIELKAFEKESKEKQNILKDKTYMSPWDYGANDPTGAYWAHYRDVMSKIKDQKGDLNYSDIDGMIGIRMRVTGYSRDQVYSAIKENAAAMRKRTMSDAIFNEKYHNRNWNRYAKETAEKFVFGARGTIQHGKAEQYRPYFMKIEGRSVTQEMKNFHEMERQREKSREREGEER